MEAGLEVFNDSGSYLIDSTYVNPCMVRKGSVTTAMDPDPPSSEKNGKARIALAANEILAFASTTPVAFVGYEDGQAVMGCTDTGVVIEYFIFAAQDTGSNGLGLQVWDAEGRKVFDSAWKILRVSGVISSGSRSMIAGRKYAVIPQQVFMRVVRDQAASTNLPTVVNRTVYAHALSISGSNIGITVDTVVSRFTRVFFPAGTSINGWTLSYNNGQTTNYLIVDVTDY